MKKVQFVGLDVHADTIAVAVAEPDGTVRSVGVTLVPVKAGDRVKTDRRDALKLARKLAATARAT